VLVGQKKKCPVRQTNQCIVRQRNPEHVPVKPGPSYVKQTRNTSPSFLKFPRPAEPSTPPGTTPSTAALLTPRRAGQRMLLRKAYSRRCAGRRRASTRASNGCGVGAGRPGHERRGQARALRDRIQQFPAKGALLPVVFCWCSHAGDDGSVVFHNLLLPACHRAAAMALE
jgi:hypothetical protein